VDRPCRPLTTTLHPLHPLHPFHPLQSRQPRHPRHRPPCMVVGTPLGLPCPERTTRDSTHQLLQPSTNHTLLGTPYRVVASSFRWRDRRVTALSQLRLCTGRQSQRRDIWIFGHLDICTSAHLEIWIFCRYMLIRKFHGSISIVEFSHNFSASGIEGGGGRRRNVVPQGQARWSLLQQGCGT
jgi:hypothetical protein